MRRRLFKASFFILSKTGFYLIFAFWFREIIMIYTAGIDVGSTYTKALILNEEREILGFDSETTFNRLCSETEENCEQPSKWQIVY